ncbi:MAG: sugar phosphate isomerase/epimerase [Treponema sp.]|jgi:sugar phosphate isomerase/epimerase|nr:sugar phosphate isomerase/epimerase [Treponema sp.]
MRLGGSVMGPYAGPEAFAAMAKECGFRAVAFPLDYRSGTAEIDRLVKVLAEEDIVIAEVGAWGNNCLSPDKNIKKASLENSKKQLALAEYIGACCCVNVTGSHTAQWDGPSQDSHSEEVFAEAVEAIREILDAVNPQKTRFCIETMPYMIPDSPDCYARLIKAVDRPGFAAHLDMVNLVNSPERYYRNADLTRECFEKFGSKIVSLHIKDITLRPSLTVHLDECLVGEGGFDHACLLKEAAKLPPDTPALVEHMTYQEEFKRSVALLRKKLEELEETGRSAAG